MKKILLGADSKMTMYLVPDTVANKLKDYCIFFCSEWIWNDPNGAKLLVAAEDGEMVAMYTEKDFIAYLNDYVFPDQQSTLVDEMDFCDYEIPKEYKNIPCFNF